MLIVCPSCATSYMIESASLGEGGRMVRCARCKATWFAGGPKEEEQVSAFVDEVIAEAEAQSDGVLPPVGEISPSGLPDAFGAAPEERFEPPPEPPAEHEAPETAPE